MGNNHVPLKFATGLSALREHRHMHDIIVNAGEVITEEVIARCKHPEKFTVIVRPQPNMDVVVRSNIQACEREEAQRLNTVSKSVPSGTVIVRDGDNSDDIYILLEGEVEVVKGEQVIATIGDAGAFIGEMAALTNQPRTATVRTVGECKFYIFQGSALLEQAQKQPVVLAKMCKSLAQKLSDIDAEFAPEERGSSENSCEAHADHKLEIPEAQAEIKTGGSQKSFAAKCALFEQHDTSLDMYILLKGSAAIIMDGKPVTTIDTPGSLIGEMSGLLCQPRTATVITTSPSVFCVVPGGDLLKFGAQHPNILMKMCLNLATRLRETNDRFLAYKKANP